MPLLFAIAVIILFPIALWKEAKKKKIEAEKRQKEIKAHEEYLKKVREEEEKRNAERAERERELKKIRIEQEKEHERRRAERDAAYQAMVNAIQPVPVSVSEEKAKKVAISFLNNLTYSTLTVRSNLEQLSNYVVIDTETTGLKCVSDEIIEVAAIRFREFEPVEKFVTLLSPSKPIPDQITEINHITDDMVAGKPCFQQIAASLVEFIGDDNIVGHNLPFDLKFIVHYGANVTLGKRKYYDTLEISRKTIRKSEGIDNFQLKTLCFWYGIPYKGAHRAEADALATGLLFQQLIDVRVNKNK